MEVRIFHEDYPEINKLQKKKGFFLLTLWKLSVGGQLALLLLHSLTCQCIMLEAHSGGGSLNMKEEKTPLTPLFPEHATNALT